MNRFVLLTATLVCCALMLMAAPIDGTWNNVSPAQGAPLTLNLTANNSVLSGTSDGTPITGGKIQGNSIWFNATRANVVYSYKGSIAGNVLNLSEARPDGSNLRNLQFLHQ